MSREKRNVGPPQYYDPAQIAAMPQWASPLSPPSPTPHRQPPLPPVVLGIVGLPTTAVDPPIPAVAPPMPTVVYQHPLMGVVYQHPLMPAAVAAGGSAVAPRMADVYVIDDPGSSAVAAGGSAVAAGGSAVAVDATAVIPSGMVRDRIAALQSAAVVLASLANSGDLEMELDPTDPNSGDLEMELDFADPNSGDWDGELDEDDIFRRQRPHRLILAHLYNVGE